MTAALYYIACYDELFDEAFQCEVHADTANKARAAGMEVRTTPFSDLPVKSRWRSLRHPDWDRDDDADAM